MTKPDKILVVGAGLAGLALAKALESRGIGFDLVERSPEGGLSGAGIYLPGNAARALAKLELLDRVEAVAHRVERQVIHDSKGAVLHDMDVLGFWRDVGPCLSLTRGALAGILRSSLRTPILSASVEAAEQTPSGCAVRFADGREEQYGLVVGADGINSNLRRTLLGGAAPRLLPQRCWRLLTENTIGLRNWTVMLGDGRALLGIPVEAGGLYVYGDADDSLAPPPSDSAIEDMRSLFTRFDHPLAPVLGNLAAHHPVHVGRLSEVPVQGWISRSAVLIGDAAHASSPAMAQGGAMAFEDACLLAECLSARPDVPAALADFSGRREERVRWVQKQCHVRDGTRSMPRFLRNGLLRLFGDALYRRAYTPLLGAFEAAPKAG